MVALTFASVWVFVTLVALTFASVGVFVTMGDLSFASVGVLVTLIALSFASVGVFATLVALSFVFALHPSSRTRLLSHHRPPSILNQSIQSIRSKVSFR